MTYIYQAYGRRLSCDVQLSYCPQASPGPADIRCYVILGTAVPPAPWCTVDTWLYSNPETRQNGQPRSELHQLGDLYALCYPTEMTFVFNRSEVTCYLSHQDLLPLFEHYLLNNFFGVWLELQGQIALHASAVAINQSAVGFIGDSGRGKSTLVASLAAQGFRLISDDVLGLEVQTNGKFLGLPGYPQLRLMPAARDAFFPGGDYQPHVLAVDSAKRRLRLTDAQFCDQPLPLKALFSVRRRTNGRSNKIVIRPTSQAEAVLILLKQSYAGRPAEAAGMARDRLRRFADLLQQAPLYHLSYPSGYEHLPAVHQSLQDFLYDFK